MARYQISLMPQRQWQIACRAHNNLFHSEEWAAVLREGFGAHTVYVQDPQSETGFAVAVFKAGPFRVGYIGFPVGGSVTGKTLEPGQISVLKRAHFPVPVHLLRLTVSGFSGPNELPFKVARVCETAIEDLPAWRLEALSSSISRNVRRAVRLGVELEDVTDPSVGNGLYNLYRDTVLRNRGGLRYTRGYFKALLCLAATLPQLRCMAAVINDEIASFVVIACSGATAYYLHGATNMRYQDHRPADLLFAKAIAWARDQGMRSFNMMASPGCQPSLVRYKEKWGATTRELQTYTLPLTFAYWPFRLAERMYRLIR